MNEALRASILEPCIEDRLTIAVADFHRDCTHEWQRLDAAQRINECARALGISPRAAIAKAEGA